MAIINTQIASRTVRCCRYAVSLGRKILPEVLQTLVSTEQRSKNRGVSQQDVTCALTGGRHPEEHVEFAVAGLNKRMRPGHINRLSRQHVDGFRIVSCQCVMWQVHVEDKGRDAGEPTTAIQISRDRKRNRSNGPSHRGWPQAILIFDWNAETLHQ